MTKNLNLSAIRTDDGKGRALTDPATSTGTVECHFRDLKGALIREIERWPVVVGCVAWLTDRDILRALAKRASMVIVQKEDFLRPDGRTSSRQLQRLYGAVQRPWRVCFDGVLGEVSTMDAFEGDAEGGIRCVGNHNSNRAPAFPRAHHKFAVFCDHGSRPVFDPAETDFFKDDATYYEPRAVWTGSFNWTNNGTNSLENAVVIRDEKIARAYFDEFQQVAALSEPLDWSSSWVAPEWRVGT